MSRLVYAAQIEREILTFIEEYVNMIYSPCFCGEKDIEEISKRYRETFEEFDRLDENELREVQSNLDISMEKVQFFIEKMKNLRKDAEDHNDIFMNLEMSLEQLYLDDILKNMDENIHLDEEQRKVVLDQSDAAMVVAGAGAGKTTTMAAKVKYLVEKQNVNPSEIIVISFTNKAVKELKERIQGQLGLKEVKVTTFHAFGNEIIRNSTEDYPEIEVNKRKYFIDILKNRIYENRVLLKNILLFFGYYMDVPEDALKYNSLAQYHEIKCSRDYETLRSVLNEYSKTVIDNLNKSARTIKGEFLRSRQEVQIANFLYLHNLDYEYEKVYEFDILNAKKKYTPDFFIRQNGREVYLEHFGIGEDGTAPYYKEEELKTYASHIEDKIRIHKKYGTKLIYTFSRYQDGRSLLEHLEAQLLECGFELQEKNEEEVYRQLVKLESDKYVYRFAVFMEMFIGKFKTNGYGAGDFDLLKKKTKNVRTHLFLDIAREVYGQYQAMLVQKRKIDFEDMINRAEEILASYDSEEELPYKYVMIDEYQDIARQRFNLTKRLAEICKAKIVAVGDDWQSIYAFSGSDITLFTQFVELMGHGKMMKITRTYRNSQELIDIAGSFVQENKEQINKRLLSSKHMKNPIVIKPYDDSKNIMMNKVAVLLDTLDEIVEEFGENAEVLLIGRYGFDMNQLCKYGDFSQSIRNRSKVSCKKYPKLRLRYLTAHSSKGLGFENVIILNGMEGKFGFPSQIEDDPIMQLVTVRDQGIAFAEERRLFYVALTRTKHRTYILTPENRPSRFVMELVEKYHLPVECKLNYQVYTGTRLRVYCPVCGAPLKKEYNNNYGLTLYMCTNEPEICDFMSNRTDFLGDIHKCSRCRKGYMIVRKNSKTGQYFFGCSNFNTEGIRCKNSEKIPQ